MNLWRKNEYKQFFPQLKLLFFIKKSWKFVVFNNFHSNNNKRL